jgi:hypothetical protein
MYSRYTGDRGKKPDDRDALAQQILRRAVGAGLAFRDEAYAIYPVLHFQTAGSFCQHT